MSQVVGVVEVVSQWGRRGYSVMMPGLLVATARYERHVPQQIIMVATWRQILVVEVRTKRTVRKLTTRKMMKVGRKHQSESNKEKMLQSGPRVMRNLPSQRTNMLPYFFLGAPGLSVDYSCSLCRYDRRLVSSPSQNSSSYQSLISILSIIIIQQIIHYFSPMSTQTDTKYWQYITREVTRVDLGHTCKECKQPFIKIGQQIAVCRGGRIQLKYHGRCFSGHPDPRTQKGSSFHGSKWKGTQQMYAPKDVYKKMRTDSHF